MCIGERFAMLEGVLILATLAREWDVVTSPVPPAIDPRFTLRPRGGLPGVTVARRTRRLLAV
jgi:cytochrome P450